MTRKKDDKKEVLAILAAPDADTAGIGELLRPKEISVDRLQKNLEEFTRKLTTALPKSPREGNLFLEEVTVTVNMTAGGKFQLVGFAGAHTQVQGGLTLKFKYS